MRTEGCCNLKKNLDLKLNILVKDGMSEKIVMHFYPVESVRRAEMSSLYSNCNQIIILVHSKLYSTAFKLNTNVNFNHACII